MVHRKYETANGSYFDYSGSGSLDGQVGEWFKITYPESVILGSFTIQANSLKSKPRSFKLFGSDSSISNFVLLGEYNDVVVSSTDPGTNFKLDSSLADYGTAYRNYFISITKIDAYSTERTVAIQNLTQLISSSRERRWRRPCSAVFMRGLSWPDSRGLFLVNPSPEC
jgi:hypothetical protein